VKNPGMFAKKRIRRQSRETLTVPHTFQGYLHGSFMKIGSLWGSARLQLMSSIILGFCITLTCVTPQYSAINIWQFPLIQNSNIPKFSDCNLPHSRNVWICQPLYCAPVYGMQLRSWPSSCERCLTSYRRLGLCYISSQIS